MTPLEMVIIDEAAQLKECESTIPLQLPGLRYATLIGDDRQLPAMVQSKVCYCLILKNQNHSLLSLTKCLLFGSYLGRLALGGAYLGDW